MTRRLIEFLCVIVTGYVLSSCQAIDGRTHPVALTDAVEPSLPTDATWPTQIAGLLPPECNAPKPSALADPLWAYLENDYEGKGCKLAVMSPDNKRLAYVSPLVQEESDTSYLTDAVVVKTLGTNGSELVVHFAHKMDYIGTILWSPTGELIVEESVWEGSWVIFIYDPLSDRMLTKIRANQVALEWNPNLTAFYAKHTGEYGGLTCAEQLGGYDFEDSVPFPDLYEVFGLQQSKDDPFGVPYGTDDNLQIEPFAWSSDGRRLWVTVTPLYRKEDEVNRYEVGPRQAGLIQLSETGAEYVALAADAHFDYSFEGVSDPKIISQVYESRQCP